MALIGYGSVYICQIFDSSDNQKQFERDGNPDNVKSWEGGTDWQDRFVFERQRFGCVKLLQLFHQNQILRQLLLYHSDLNRHGISLDGY